MKSILGGRLTRMTGMAPAPGPAPLKRQAIDSSTKSTAGAPSLASVGRRDQEIETDNQNATQKLPVAIHSKPAAVPTQSEPQALLTQTHKLSDSNRIQAPMPRIAKVAHAAPSRPSPLSRQNCLPSTTEEDGSGDGEDDENKSEENNENEKAEENQNE